MNKILIGIGIVTVVVIGWFLLQGDTVNYVTEVNDEVTALETELAEIEAAVLAGTLTPEDAAQAQTKIVNRLNSINTASTAGQNAKLTDAQRAQLVEGLERLKQTLIKYQATLMTVDEGVMELSESERPILSRHGGGGSGKANIADIVAETISATEEQIGEIIDEVTDEELAEELTDSTSETYVSEDETSTSTEEMGSEEGDSADDIENSTEEPTEDVSENVEETATDDTGTEENSSGN